MLCVVGYRAHRTLHIHLLAGSHDSRAQSICHILCKSMTTVPASELPRCVYMKVEECYLDTMQPIILTSDLCDI